MIWNPAVVPLSTLESRYKQVAYAHSVVTGHENGIVSELVDAVHGWDLCAPPVPPAPHRATPHNSLHLSLFPLACISIFYLYTLVGLGRCTPRMLSCEDLRSCLRGARGV